MFEPVFFAERSISSLKDKFTLPLRELKETGKLIIFYVTVRSGFIDLLRKV